MRMRWHPSVDDASGPGAVLLSHAHNWLHRVPSCLHPKRLCRERPDIANRLASAWHHPRERLRILEGLAPDRPGGQVLSPRAQLEAANLYRYARGQLRITYPAPGRRARLPSVIVEVIDDGPAPLPMRDAFEVPEVPEVAEGDASRA